MPVGLILNAIGSLLQRNRIQTIMFAPIKVITTQVHIMSVHAKQLLQMIPVKQILIAPGTSRRTQIQTIIYARTKALIISMKLMLGYVRAKLLKLFARTNQQSVTGTSLRHL